MKKEDKGIIIEKIAATLKALAPISKYNYPIIINTASVATLSPSATAIC